MDTKLIEALLESARRKGLLDSERAAATRRDLEVAAPAHGSSRIALVQLRGVLRNQGVAEADVVELLEEELARRADLGEGGGSRAGAADIFRASAPTLQAGRPPASGAGPAEASDPDWSPPDYELLELLGTGAVGEVFKARDRRLDRLVAIKVMHAQASFERERFQAEARHQARLEHLAICQVHEVGEHQGRPFIVMQLIEGQTLQDAAPGLSTEHKIELVRQVAEGVHAAHRIGLIHRDLKPSNIMVEQAEDGLRAYVLDFGIARDTATPGLTRTGMVVGTPWYMAPEQISGRQDLDRRTDVYGLGTVLYELFAGKPPFTGDSSMAVLSRILSEEPPRLRGKIADVPRDIERVVDRCLEKAPADRYESARALAEDLSRYLAGEPVVASGRGPTAAAVRWYRGNRALAWVCGLALIFVAVLVAQQLRSRALAERRAALAQETGRAVESMEWLLRASRQLPKHDLTPQKNELRRRVEQIRGSTSEQGTLGRQAGLYAAGRGALILEQLDEARDLLDRAWRAGLRGSEISEARGLTLGLLFDRERQLARAIVDRDLREQRLQEIETQFLDPARTLLESAAAGGAATGLLAKAWLAYFSDEDEQAASLAEEVTRQAPWLHEGRLLAARVALRLAQDTIDQRDFEQARARIEEAEQQFSTTLAVARSESRAYHGLCQLAIERLNLSHLGQAEPEPAYERGLDWCDSGIEIDPENAQSWLLRAQLHTEWGDALEWKVQDTSQVMQLARSDAERALVLQPDLTSAYVVIGSAEVKRANEMQRRGEDPGEASASAVAFLELALELDPGRAAPYRLIAEVLQIRGRFLQGPERIELQREALTWLERLLEISPDNQDNLGTIANAWLQLADGLATEGQDPLPAIGEAERYYAAAIEAHTPVSWLYSNQSIVYLMKAREEARTGTDPRATLDAATANVERALALNDEDPFAWFNRGEAERERARWMMLAGVPQSPGERAQLSEVLQRGRSHYRQGLDLAPSIGQAWVDMARFDVMSAEVSLRAGDDPTEELELARSALRRALEVDKSRVSAPCELALVEALQIDAMYEAPVAAGVAERGLAAIAGCLELAPWNADYLRAPLRAAWRLRALAPPSHRERVRRLGVALANSALELQPDHLEAQAYQAAFSLFGAETAEAEKWKQQLNAAIERSPGLGPRFESLIADEASAP